MRVDKQVLRQTMLGLEAERLEASLVNYEAYLANALADQSQVRDAQDKSQTKQSGDYAEAFDAPIHSHQEAIAQIEATDFADTDTVQPGAVVKWAGQNFILAALTHEFECQGETFMGISCQAPIAEQMMGQAAGGTFEFSGQSYQIEDVY